MGKLKKKFNEKKDAVKFKLVYRSTEDPNYQKGTLADRVFQVIDEKKSGKQDPNSEAKKAKILSGFSDKDLGKYTTPRKIENYEIEADEDIENSKDGEEDIDNPTVKKKKNKANSIEGRTDLWINHLKKAKEEVQIQSKPQEKKKAVKDEEWEDCGEEEEWEEFEDIEEDDAELEEEEKNINGEKNIKQGKIMKVEKITNEEKNTKEEKNIPKQKLSELSEKMLSAPDPINILKNFEVNPNVKMKYYDENGLLIDGYDYYQHIAKKDSAGVVQVVYNAEYEQPPELKPDFDYQPEEMTPEQKEVFEALLYEGEEQAYENIEDNFVDIANCGEKCLDSKKPIEELLAHNKEEEEIMKQYDEEEKMPDIPEILTKQDFKRVMNEYIAHMEKKNEKNDLVNPKKHPNKKAIQEEEEEDESSEEEAGDYVKKVIIAPENVDKIKKEEIFTRKTYDKLDPKEDICLQNYLMKDSSESEDEEPREKSTQIDDSPTIEDISKVHSTIAPKLNIIKENNKIKENKKSREVKNEEIELKTNDENNDDEQKDEQKDEVKEIFKKREKGETPEEKAERKAKIKAFKQDRKDKKQKFKEEFKYQHIKELKKSRPNHNITHVSVYKL